MLSSFPLLKGTSYTRVRYDSALQDHSATADQSLPNLCNCPLCLNSQKMPRNRKHLTTLAANKQVPSWTNYLEQMFPEKGKYDS